MSEAPELKPCPFCGGAAWINDYEAKHGAMPARSRCPQCKSCGCSLGYHPTESKAIAAWNRRADLVAVPNVTVKPLEWADLGDGTFRALLPIIGSIRVEPYGCCDWWEVVWSMPGQCDKLIPDVFDSPDDAKAAAQAEYEARIMAAIQIGPASGWQPIETAPRDGTNFIGWDGKRAFRCSSVKHYEKWPHQDGGPTFLDVWCGHQEYSIDPENPTHWMPLPKQPTKDSTHD